jgi:hypothetical protein
MSAFAVFPVHQPFSELVTTLATVLIFSGSVRLLNLVREFADRECKP